MTKYKVTCAIENCENQNLGIEVNAPIVNGVEQDHINAICGACGNAIVNVEVL